MMSFYKDKNKKPKKTWKVVLVVSLALLAVIIVAVVVYGKWCESETKPLLNRIEQIANHKIKVDSSAGEEYRFSLNLPDHSNREFLESSIKIRYVFIIGTNGEIKIEWINTYKNTPSNESIQIITFVDLYIERIDDQWVIKDMMALA